MSKSELRIPLERFGKRFDHSLVQRHPAAANVIRAWLALPEEVMNTSKLTTSYRKMWISPTAADKSDPLIQPAHRAHKSA
jgi:hypothetical protein